VYNVNRYVNSNTNSVTGQNGILGQTTGRTQASCNTGLCHSKGDVWQHNLYGAFSFM
jgi:hypothetical protein